MNKVNKQQIAIEEAIESLECGMVAGALLTLKDSLEDKHCYDAVHTIEAEVLIGDGLDRLVSSAEGHQPSASPLAYSSEWLHGGPIIHRENISLEPPCEEGKQWKAVKWGVDGNLSHGSKATYGPDPLIAAMRCYVANVFGAKK